MELRAADVGEDAAEPHNLVGALAGGDEFGLCRAGGDTGLLSGFPGYSASVEHKTVRHVTGSFFAYRFVALLRNILTGIRFVKLRLFGLRTGPVAVCCTGYRTSGSTSAKSGICFMYHINSTLHVDLLSWCEVALASSHDCSDFFCWLRNIRHIIQGRK